MKTHCPAGHRYSAANTKVRRRRGRTERSCRECGRIYHKEYVRRVVESSRNGGTCRVCDKPITRAHICARCSVCACGSGRPPGLCHGRSASGFTVARDTTEKTNG